MLFIEDTHNPVNKLKFYLYIHQLSLFFFHSQAFVSEGCQGLRHKPTENHQNNLIRLSRDLITGLVWDTKY